MRLFKLHSNEGIKYRIISKEHVGLIRSNWVEEITINGEKYHGLLIDPLIPGLVRKMNVVKRFEEVIQLTCVTFQQALMQSIFMRDLKIYPFRIIQKSEKEWMEWKDEQLIMNDGSNYIITKLDVSDDWLVESKMPGSHTYPKRLKGPYPSTKGKRVKIKGLGNDNL